MTLLCRQFIFLYYIINNKTINFFCTMATCFIQLKLKTTLHNKVNKKMQTLSLKWIEV